MGESVVVCIFFTDSETLALTHRFVKKVFPSDLFFSIRLSDCQRGILIIPSTNSLVIHCFPNCEGDPLPCSFYFVAQLNPFFLANICHPKTNMGECCLELCCIVL